MVRARGDDRTGDLLAWEPRTIKVRRYDERVVRTASLRSRIARAVSETLKDSPLSREEIATAMSEWLGEDVTKNMLDAYASEGREEHTIPYLRLLAMTHVTMDMRLLQLGTELFGHLVVDNKYLAWVEVGMEADRREQIGQLGDEVERSFNAKLRAARGATRP